MEKRTCWEGENEYRLIYKDIEKINNFTDAISAIYVGADVDKKNILNAYSFEIYKIYPDRNDGRLNRILANNIT